jgi:polyphosphate kinase 2
MRAPSMKARTPTRRNELRALQIELVKLQRHLIATGAQVVVLFEGRDAAGKDGTIKRITEHLSPRNTRIVALGVPKERDRDSWYFQRFVPHLPAAGELVLFNRSWYNRAGVERVMRYCTRDDYEQFLVTAPIFERLLKHCGFTLIKYYLDISKREQKRRLGARRRDPLKQWKLSPVDARAQKLWKRYTRARDVMLKKTHTDDAPWSLVRADDKDAARRQVIRDLLARFEYPGRRFTPADRDVLFEFEPQALTDGRLAR